MNLLPKTIVVAAIISLNLAAFSQAALAFSFNYDGKNYPVSQEQQQAWQGSDNFNPNLWPAAPNLNQMLDAAVGQVDRSQNQIQLKQYQYRFGKIYESASELSKSLNQPSIEPELIMADNQVATFTPPQVGLTVDVFHSALAALHSLENNLSSSTLVVLSQDPKTPLSATNSLGIRELIGEGVSNFAGSPKNRRFNIAVGYKKFRGTIVLPGETFDFNKILGPVDASTGFLPELVIKSNDTVPEFGGGLCQVSTTVFRAAMQTGLPITQRKNHAYAVKYYSPQGTDATIYPGSANLKFLNDTPGAILIWPYLKDNNTLVFDFYGTSDGRQVTLKKPVVYDQKSDGSMKASWTRDVVKNGQTITDTFKSVYLPPALFHKTETFVTSTPASTASEPIKTN